MVLSPDPLFLGSIPRALRAIDGVSLEGRMRPGKLMSNLVLKTVCLFSVGFPSA